ncbi:MAG: hypothetical protein QXS42_00535 [Zestosphaera sp.]
MKGSSSIVEKYRRMVALITGDIKRYRRASKEVKTAAYLTPLAVTLPLVLHYLEFLQDPALLAIVGLSLGLAAWVRVIDTATSLQGFRRKLDEELPFFTLTATAVSRTGLEPVELLRFLTSSEVFSAFRELGRRFWGLSEAFGSSEGLAMLARLASGRVRPFLTEYTLALASGTALQHLRDRAMDFVKTVAVEVERTLGSRMVAAMVISMFFSVMPVVLISMTALFTTSLEDGAPGAPAFIQVLAPAIVGASALLAVVLPGYPLAVQVVMEGKVLTACRAAFASGTGLLALPPIMLSLGLMDLSGFRELTIYCSLVAAALGAVPFTHTLKALMTRIDDVVESMAQHVRVYRSMHLYRNERLEGLGRRSVRPWLAGYLRESTEFFRLLGDVDPSVFDLFVMFVMEVRRTMGRAMAHVAFMAAVVLLAPVLSTATMGLGAGLGVAAETLLTGYASVLGFGYIAGKIALGRNVSTLLPGLAALLYALTLTA